MRSERNLFNKFYDPSTLYVRRGRDKKRGGQWGKKGRKEQWKYWPLMLLPVEHLNDGTCNANAHAKYAGNQTLQILVSMQNYSYCDCGGWFYFSLFPRNIVLKNRQTISTCKHNPTKGLIATQGVKG